MASRLYKAGITRPWTRHVQPCHYTGKLQAHKLEYELYSYYHANYIHTASPNRQVDDNLYMTLPEGTGVSANFTRLNKAINGLNQPSYEDLQ